MSVLNMALSPDTFDINGRLAGDSEELELLKELSHRLC